MLFDSVILKLRGVWTLLFFFGGFSSLFAQGNIDSLRQQLELVGTDSAFSLYINLSNEYSVLRRHDSAIHFAQRALQLSDQLDLPNARAYRQLGYAYLMAGENELTLKYLVEGEQRALIEEDTLSLSWIYTHLGAYFLDVSLYDSALFYSMKGAAIATSLRQKIPNNRTIGLSYFYTGQLEKAIATQLESLKLVENEDEKDIISVSENLAGFYYYAGKYDSAMLIYQKVYQLFDKQNLHYKRLRTLSNMGSLAYAKKDYAQAIDIYQRVIRESRKEGLDDKIRRTPYINLSVNYRELGQLKKAHQYLDTAQLIYTKYGDSRSLQEVLEYRYLLDSMQGDKDAMIADLKRSIVFGDSVRKQQHDEKYAELQTQYETDKKDQEIENLSQQAAIQDLEISKQRNQLIIGGLLAIVLLLGGFVYYRQQKASREKAAAELEQRFLRSQLNPHFIFNSMTAIQQYLEENEPEGASHYMGMFSTLMRQILENSRQEFITLAEEVSMLENYLQLQQIRFRDQFDYEIEIDEELDEDYTGVPPMFAQPFIENSLEHGLFRKEGEKNQIKIYFRKINKNLVGLEIEDSGVGITTEKETVNHKSLATRITNERLSKLRTIGLSQIGLDTQNILNEQGDIHGYRVNLRLPTQLVSV